MLFGSATCSLPFPLQTLSPGPVRRRIAGHSQAAASAEERKGRFWKQRGHVCGCGRWWKNGGGPSRQISGSHARVIRLCEGLGLADHSVQLATGVGLPSIDFAVRDASGRKFGVQVPAPSVVSCFHQCTKTSDEHAVSDKRL